MVEPPPTRKPHPPFWVAAGSPASIRRAARRGFNLILDQYASPELLGQRIALYRAERQAVGLRELGADRRRPPSLCRQGPRRHRSGAAKAGGLDQAHRRGGAHAGRHRSGSHVLAYAETPQGTEATRFTAAGRDLPDAGS